MSEEMVERDISFETLAQVCGIDITQLTRDARGQLNGALKQLREAMPDLADLELALVIEDKAKLYRQVMGDALLTPTALAKHWAGLEGLRAAEPQSYPKQDPPDCATCGGLRLVLVGYRPPKPSAWQIEMRSAQRPELGLPHPAHRKSTDGYEVYSPCPACNAKALEVASEWWQRFDRIYGHRPYAPPEEMLQALGEAVHAAKKPEKSSLIP